MAVQVLPGAFLAGAGINAAGNIANGQSGNSTASSYGYEKSLSDSANSFYNQSDSQSKWWNNAYSDSIADSWSYNSAMSNAENYGYSNGGSTVLGAEASARDYQYAMLANKEAERQWMKQAEWSEAQAAKDMAFQEYMSNTAYQRAVKDLLAAGLNPILAVGNMGASTPVGAMASTAGMNTFKGNSTADSSSWSSSRNYGYSQSRAYGESGSHAEAHSKESGGGYSSSHSQGGGSGYSHSNSYGENSSNSQSQNANNLVKALQGIAGLISGGSAKNQGGGGFGGGNQGALQSAKEAEKNTAGKPKKPKDGAW